MSTADCAHHAQAQCHDLRRLLALCAVGAGAGDLRIDPATDKPTPDLSARPRIGKASFYAKMFNGRKMADGTPMDPMGDNAASRTLAVGHEGGGDQSGHGRSSVVTIRDRGPYVHGRIVDLSPATAQQLGITPRIGVAMVEVSPISVPLPNGSVRWGQGSEVATSASVARS